MSRATLPPPEVCDEHLVAQTQGNQTNSATAFSLLAARYTPLVRQLAARYGGNGIDTDDLAQEGFLGLLAAIRTFSPDQSACFRTYASVCIRNRIISHLRKQTAAPAPLPDAPEAEPQADPISRLIDQEAAAALQAQLKSLLSAMEYQILLMHLRSFSYQEMASRLHTTPKAIDNAWQRVRRKCRHLLA